jgi:hypothetical protein
MTYHHFLNNIECASQVQENLVQVNRPVLVRVLLKKSFFSGLLNATFNRNVQFYYVTLNIFFPIVVFLFLSVTKYIIFYCCYSSFSFNVILMLFSFLRVSVHLYVLYNIPGTIAPNQPENAQQTQSKIIIFFIHEKKC